MKYIIKIVRIKGIVLLMLVIVHLRYRCISLSESATAFMSFDRLDVSNMPYIICIMKHKCSSKQHIRRYFEESINLVGPGFRDLIAKKF